LAAAALVLTLLGLIYKVRLNTFRKLESMKRERIQSQFETLKNQVNPHFLFNSLNTLISLISKEKDMAISYVETLSDYFRTILQQQDKDVINVQDELHLVQNYFFLQQKRFGENLKLEISIPKEVLKTSIPPLTLQILAENAIKHNIISKTKPLLISIHCDGKFITVSNNLQEKLTREASTGIGLRNIINRYAILFNKEIEVLKGEKEYTVRLPVIAPLH
jgi:LytS/YehU family sensor histidine kinase